jgi:hypothetical protein
VLGAEEKPIEYVGQKNKRKETLLGDVNSTDGR